MFGCDLWMLAVDGGRVLGGRERGVGERLDGGMGRGRERAAEGSWDGYTEHGEITEANEIEAV